MVCCFQCPLTSCDSSRLSNFTCQHTVGCCLQNDRLVRCLIALRIKVNSFKGGKKMNSVERSWGKEFEEINVCLVKRSTTYHGKESVVDKYSPTSIKRPPSGL